MRHSNAALALLLVASLACEGEDDGFTVTTGGGAGGSFEATVTGAAATSFRGTASFVVETSGGVQFFTLTLLSGTGSQQETIRFERDGADRLTTGTYALGDEANTEVVAIYTRGDEASRSASFTSQSGQLVISASTASRLQGTFTISAVGQVFADPGVEALAALAGTFNARCTVSATVSCGP